MKSIFLYKLNFNFPVTSSFVMRFHLHETCRDFSSCEGVDDVRRLHQISALLLDTNQNHLLFSWDVGFIDLQWFTHTKNTTLSLQRKYSESDYSCGPWQKKHLFFFLHPSLLQEWLQAFNQTSTVALYSSFHVYTSGEKKIDRLFPVFPRKPSGRSATLARNTWKYFGEAECKCYLSKMS